MASIEINSLCDALLLELTSTEEPHQECDCTGNLTHHGTMISCTTHERCASSLVSRVCFSCMRRYCSGCFNDLHQNPSLFGCLTMSYVTYVDLNTMFRRFGVPNKQKNGQLTMSTDVILTHHKKCISKQKSAKHCRHIIRDLRDQFGGDYQVTLLEFARQYTKGNALSFTVVEAAPVQAFHSLNSCGRCFYGLSKRGIFNGTGFLCFSRMLRRIQSDQGENVYSILNMMYHLLVLNFFGLIFYVGILFIPWILSGSLRDQVTSTNTTWVGLISGFGLDNLPISYGGFPDPTFVPENSTQWFNLLLPIYIFAIFALGTMYSFHLLIKNRQSLSETLSSPSLVGSVSATAFSMFKFNSTTSQRRTNQAHADYETNLRMAMVKKNNISEVKQGCWKKVKARSWFPMILSFILILASASGLVVLDYYAISQKYIKKENFGEYANHFQLLMPAVFFIVRFIVERMCIGLVKREVPKKVHLYNHFRSVLYYRLNFLNFCYLIALIVLSMLQLSRHEPYHVAINVAKQIELGYCTTASDCSCGPSHLGFFWYSYLFMWIYFELFTLILSIFRGILQKCIIRVDTYFSPIPRVCQIWFLQAMVWCSIFSLPASPIIGFIATFVAFFSTYFKTQVLKSRPESGVYLLPSKIQFYSAFIILLLVSYVPSAIVMSQTPNCGPFINTPPENNNIYGQFSDATMRFPVVVKQFFHYATSPVVLWLLIICACAAIIAISRMTHVAKSTRNKLINQLKIESHHRSQLIAQLGDNFKAEDSRGAKLYLQWMMKVTQNQTITSSGEFSLPSIQHYLLKIQRKYPNFLELVRLSNDQLMAVFLHCGCPLHFAELLTESLRRFRAEVVLRSQRVL